MLVLFPSLTVSASDKQLEGKTQHDQPFLSPKTLSHQASELCLLDVEAGLFPGGLRSLG